MPLGQLRQRIEVGHIDARIGQGLEKEGFRLFVNQLFRLFGTVHVEKTRLDTEPFERMRRQRQRTAVELRSANDIVPGFGGVGERVENCRHAAGGRQCRRTAFERSHTLFEHIRRRVVQARIDIAEFLEREQVCRMLRVAEFIGGRLINRNRHRPLLILAVALVQRFGLKMHGLPFRYDSLALPQ